MIGEKIIENNKETINPAECDVNYPKAYGISAKYATNKKWNKWMHIRNDSQKINPAKYADKYYEQWNWISEKINKWK